jgi:hypothetical protein
MFILVQTCHHQKSTFLILKKGFWIKYHISHKEKFNNIDDSIFYDTFSIMMSYTTW